jgi:hypothetical protein
VRTLLAIAIAAALVSSCGIFQPGGAAPTPEVAVPYPDGCGAFNLSARRCKAILDWAVAQPAAAGRVPTSVEMLGDPGCGAGTDPHVLCMRSTSFIVRMRLHFEGGGASDESVFCGVGGQYSLLCTETPEIPLYGSMFGGYWDTTGATPPPIPAKFLAASRPLSVLALDIPVDHLGHYEIEAGRALVPMGILTHATVRLENPQTQALTVSEDGVRFVIRSAEPGAKPFNNLYERGWHDGVEEVVAVIAFDVTSFQPGAVLALRDLAVN